LYSEENHRLNGALSDLHEKHKALQAAHDELHAAHAALKNKPDNTIEILRTEIKELKAALAKMDAVQKEKDDLEHELYEKDRALSEAKGDLEAAKDEEDKLRAEIDRLQKEIDEHVCGPDSDDIRRLEVQSPLAPAATSISRVRPLVLGIAQHLTERSLSLLACPLPLLFLPLSCYWLA